LVNKAITKLSSLDELYEKADNKEKREIIGSIYPEKLVFDGFNYRTARLNEAVELIYKLGDGFSENQNGQTGSNFDLSTLVHRGVQFSNHFIPDLTRLANLLTG
jgi:site-specific DNA recombinase